MAVPHAALSWSSGEAWENETNVSGFAWVKVTPGNRGFGAWLVRNGLASAAHDFGVDLYPPSFGSSALAPGDAYCSAFARIVSANGVHCRADSRLD